MEFFSQPSHWHWLILALLLLGGEALVTAGLLLGAVGAAAIMTVINLIMDDFSWQWQIALFVGLTIALSVRYWQQFQSFNNKTDQPQLNDRAAQLIGYRFTLSQDIVGGQGKQQVGETFWRLRADTDLPANSPVEIVASENMVLVIEKG